MSVSLAFVIAFIGLAASWATNRAGDGWDDRDEIESVAVDDGLLVLFGVTLIPAVQNFVLDRQAVSFVAFLALSAVFGAEMLTHPASTQWTKRPGP